MNSDDVFFVDVDKLRVGLYVELDVGWMAHPFPTGSFKITSAQQIEAIRGLGAKRIRCLHSKSDAQAVANDASPGAEHVAVAVQVYDPVKEARKLAAQQALEERKRRSELLSAQSRSLAACERRFGEAIRQYRKTLELVKSEPTTAAAQAQGMVTGIVGEMLGDGESSIRLLSEAAGDKSSMHPVNVTILSLLLGHAMGLSSADLADLGMAAF